MRLLLQMQDRIPHSSSFISVTIFQFVGIGVRCQLHPCADSEVAILIFNVESTSIRIQLMRVFETDLNTPVQTKRVENLSNGIKLFLPSHGGNVVIAARETA